jgi:hypothetical protein
LDVGALVHAPSFALAWGNGMHFISMHMLFRACEVHVEWRAGLDAVQGLSLLVPLWFFTRS